MMNHKQTTFFVLLHWQTNSRAHYTQMPLENSQKCPLTENNIFFVAYDYDTNYIFALPIANVQEKTIIKAFNKVFAELTEKGHKPTFNVTDNQAVTPLKKYLRAKNYHLQFFERIYILRGVIA